METCGSFDPTRGNLRESRLPAAGNTRWEQPFHTPPPLPRMVLTILGSATFREHRMPMGKPTLPSRSANLFLRTEHCTPHHSLPLSWQYPLAHAFRAKGFFEPSRSMTDAKQFETKMNQTSRSQYPRAQRCAPRKVRIDTLNFRLGSRGLQVILSPGNP